MESEFSLKDLRSRVEVLLGNLEKVLARTQTGRAHPSALDGITVLVYENQMPLNQVATILAPDATTLQVTPFDSQNINSVCEAIRQHPQLNLTPRDDGRHVYLTIPPLTTEGRQRLVKTLSAEQEEFLIQLRGLRQQQMKEIKDLPSEDERKDWEKQVESLVEETKQKIVSQVSQKTTAIMEIGE